MTLKIFQDQSPQKCVARLGSNSRPLDQQLDLLPIALQGPARSILKHGISNLCSNYIKSQYFQCFIYAPGLSSCPLCRK